MIISLSLEVYGSFIQMSESTTRVNFDKVFEAGVEWSGVCHQKKNHSLIAIPERHHRRHMK